MGGGGTAGTELRPGASPSGGRAPERPDGPPPPGGPAAFLREKPLFWLLRLLLVVLSLLVVVLNFCLSGAKSESQSKAKLLEVLF